MDRLRILGFPKTANTQGLTPEEEDLGINPHGPGWRGVWGGLKRHESEGGKARMARKAPVTFVASTALSHLFKGASLQEAAEKLAQIRSWWQQKQAGEWEQGSGGSAAHVISLTPQSLGVSGGGLGGSGVLQNIASMQMRPTMAGGMYGGWGGGDASSVVNAYRGAAGGTVGW